MTDPMGGREPSQDPAPTGAQLVTPRSGSRGLLLGIIAVVGLLVLAVAKPWGGPGQPPEPGLPSAGPVGEVASPAVMPAPSATPPGYDSPGGQCFPGSDWRVFTVETNMGQDLRTWLSIEPGVAAGPRDRAVPFVRVVTDRVLALGFCAGSGPPGPASLVGTRAWVLSDEGPIPIVLAPLAAYMPREADLGAVYRPPAATPAPSTGASPAGVAQAWPPGRYVFAVRQGSATSEERWFGVEVVASTRQPVTREPATREPATQEPVAPQPAAP